MRLKWREDCGRACTSSGARAANAGVHETSHSERGRQKKMSSGAQHEGIAIVGVGTLLPGATSVGAFWRNVLSGRELMRDIPANYWLAEDFYDPDPRKVDKIYCKRGAFLDEVDFDPMKYGVPPKLLTSTDSCQLLALMVADQVLHDAFGQRFDSVSRERVGCVIGVCSGLELV